MHVLDDRGCRSQSLSGLLGVLSTCQGIIKWTRSFANSMSVSQPPQMPSRSIKWPRTSQHTSRS